MFNIGDQQVVGGPGKDLKIEYFSSYDLLDTEPIVLAAAVTTNEHVHFSCSDRDPPVGSCEVLTGRGRPEPHYTSFVAGINTV